MHYVFKYIILIKVHKLQIAKEVHGFKNLRISHHKIVRNLV